MIDPQATSEIIRHRALGLSFDRIKTTTGISKPTIIKVCNEHTEEIADAREVATIIARKEIAQEITERRLAYSRLWHKGFDELMGRDWSQFSNTELVKLMGTAERSMVTLEGNDQTADDWLLPPMGVARAQQVLEGLD